MRTIQYNQQGINRALPKKTAKAHLPNEKDDPRLPELSSSVPTTRSPGAVTTGYECGVTSSRIHACRMIKGCIDVHLCTCYILLYSYMI